VVDVPSTPEPAPNTAFGDDPLVRTPAQAAAWDALRERLNITLRPVASPVSLGMFGLAAATLVLSGLQLDWVEPTEGRTVAFVLIGFAFVAQVLASLVAMGARDGVVATAMGVLGLTWLVVGIVLFGLAMYVAWAAQLEGATGKTVLPIGRRNTGALAVRGSLLEQTSHVPNEPGVRRML
jgi:succinate-acetate transporter protein